MPPSRSKLARAFVLRFAAVYALLLLPWPGLLPAYSACLQGLGRAVFASDAGPRELAFQSVKSERGLHLTRVEIVNRSLMQPDGSGPVRNLDLETGGLWRTTALFLALAAVSPFAWPRRWRMLLWGFLWLQAFILFTLGLSIWTESRHVALISLGPLGQSFADRLQQAIVAQFSIAAPVLIWVLVAFRRANGFVSPLETQPSETRLSN